MWEVIVDQIEAIDLTVVQREGRLTADLRMGENVTSGIALPDLPDGAVGDLRWLLEDYPRLPPGVARFAAEEAENRLIAFGRELGTCLDPVLKVALEQGVSYDQLQLRISDDAGHTRHWPWELISTEEGELGLLLGAILRNPAKQATQPPAAPTPRPTNAQHPLRVLYVISRPRSTEDVPFRCVASRVLKAIEGTAVQLDILRPPVIEALEERLALAREEGTPYDVVHFDGHGELVETMTGPRGVILFEDSSRKKARHVDARRIARILERGAVRALILNACHSGGTLMIEPAVEEEASQMRAVASFAESVAAHASVDVVAMSHAVFVNTAAHIVDDIFGCLANGAPVSQAVRYARRRWSAGAASRSPGIGHAIIRTFGQMALHPSPASLPPYRPFLIDNSATPAHPDLPKVFHAPQRLLGTDDTVLSLEKALVEDGHVLLTGLKGSGRTSMLLEFGRWLAATRFVQADRIGYVDLGTTESAEQAMDILASDRSRVLLVDHAECIHGSLLMKQPAWTSQMLARLGQVLDAASYENRQVIFAAHASIADVGNLTTEPIRPLELDDMLGLAEDILDQPDAGVALLWSAGHPGSLDVLRRYAAEDWFANAKHTLDLLKELSSGLFIEVTPPLDDMTPLLIKNGMAITPNDIAPLWLISQFQGCFVFPHRSYGVEHAARSFRGSYLAIFEPENRPMELLSKLQDAGLVNWHGKQSLWLHPLLPCVAPSPYTADGYRTEDGRTALTNIATFFSGMLVWADPERSSPVPEPKGCYPAGPWGIPSLLRGWHIVSGELGISHERMVELVRRLRLRLLEIGAEGVWLEVLTRTIAVFREYPQENREHDPTASLGFLALLGDEAERTGDDSMLRDAASAQVDLAAQVDWNAADDGQKSQEYAQMLNRATRLDAAVRTGRALLRGDHAAARTAFEQALEIADYDMLKRVRPLLELTKLLRSSQSEYDLPQALDYGEEAVEITTDLLRMKMIDPGLHSDAALSTSNVYIDIVTALDDDFLEGMERGEFLGEQSLKYAASDGQRARACLNLSNWRRMRNRPAEAAELLIESASLFEASGERSFVGATLLMYARALAESGKSDDAVAATKRAESVFRTLGDDVNVRASELLREEILQSGTN